MAETYSPDVAEQIPAGGNPNTPTSGAYGEDAALQRLEAALPGMDAEEPAESAPTPSMSPLEEPAGPPGLPQGLFAPTRQPGTPVGTPLTDPNIYVGQGVGRRVQILEALAQSPEVSAETKEWATLVLNHLRSVR